MKNRLLFSLLFSGNYCMGTTSTGWPQTWKTWKTQEIWKIVRISGKTWRKLWKISIFEEKPGKLRENVRYVP